ncbi:MAG TPA: hypothetical protein PKY50_18745 [Candidatus Competibacter sp.]|nr:hypothetical protein [Candidatus Competibacter sp.]
MDSANNQYRRIQRPDPQGNHGITLNDPLGAAIALLLALGRLQSRSLRWSAKEIQRLIQW